MLCYRDGDGNVHKIASFTAPANARAICVYNGSAVEKYPLTTVTSASPDNAHQQPTFKSSLYPGRCQIARNINGTWKYQLSVDEVCIGQYWATGTSGYAIAEMMPHFRSSFMPLTASYTDNVIEESRAYSTVPGVGISFVKTVSIGATLTSALQEAATFSIKSGRPYTRTFGGSVSVCTSGVYFHCRTLSFYISHYISQYPESLGISWDKESGATSMSTTMSKAYGTASVRYSVSLSHRDTAAASRSSISYKVSASINATSIGYTSVRARIGYAANQSLSGSMTYYSDYSRAYQYLYGTCAFTHCQTLYYRIAQRINRVTLNSGAAEQLVVSADVAITNTASTYTGTSCSKSTQYTYHWDNIYTT